jgi:hypothetical protein
MPQPSAELKVDFDPSQPGCPADGSCGFVEGDEVLIFDESGHFDTFSITNVQDSANHLQHRGQDLSYSYAPPNAMILKVKSYSFYLDTTTKQLMRYDGGTDDPTPIVDNVVDLKFEYFGDPNPPLAPKPTLGTANCLYDTLGNYTASGLTTLTTAADRWRRCRSRCSPMVPSAVADRISSTSTCSASGSCASRCASRRRTRSCAAAIRRCLPIRGPASAGRSTSRTW